MLGVVPQSAFSAARLGTNTRIIYFGNPSLMQKKTINCNPLHSCMLVFSVWWDIYKNEWWLPELSSPKNCVERVSS